LSIEASSVDRSAPPLVRPVLQEEKTEQHATEMREMRYSRRGAGDPEV
jgi:hypothetical protein